ncbi:hypothetical protein BH20ACT19_BH20ACT19_02470 [soil metagenome]
MAVHVRCITDPACVWSWASEPGIRALRTEFGADLQWTFVMGGLARELPAAGLAKPWMDASAESGMPTDPRVWLEVGMKSTYPACIAVKAAADQAADRGYGYLRALREGIFCFARKLDAPEALTSEARDAGLDVERFRIDLASNATVEAFGADLEEARDVPAAAAVAGKVRCSQPAGRERVTFPTFVFAGAGGEVSRVFGHQEPEALREAALAAGAQALGEPRPGVLDALRRWSRMAAPEVAAVCDLPLLKAEAELAELALQWRARPVPVLAGRLWEAA